MAGIRNRQEGRAGRKSLGAIHVLWKQKVRGRGGGKTAALPHWSKKSPFVLWVSGFHSLSVVLLFCTAPSTSKGRHITWAVVVYFKCSCVSSLVGTPPPPWSGNEGHWHLPDSRGDRVSHSWLGAVRRETCWGARGCAARSHVGRRTQPPVLPATCPTSPAMGIPEIVAHKGQHSITFIQLELPNQSFSGLEPGFGRDGFGQVGSPGSGMGSCVPHLSAWAVLLLVAGRWLKECGNGVYSTSEDNKIYLQN